MWPEPFTNLYLTPQDTQICLLLATQLPFQRHSTLTAHTHSLTKLRWLGISHLLGYFSLLRSQAIWLKFVSNPTKWKMCHTQSILYLQHLYFYTHLIPTVLPLFFMLYLTRSFKNLNFEQHPQTFPASVKKKPLSSNPLRICTFCTTYFLVISFGS